MKDYYQEQWVAVTESLIERISDLKYEAYGPEGFDPDYRKQLKEDGDWDEYVEKWEQEDKPTDERLAELEIRLDELDDVYRLCEGARKRQVSRMKKRGYPDDTYIFNYR